MRHIFDKLWGFYKDFSAFRVGQVRHLTSAEFAFLFMVSNTISTFGDIRKCYFAQKGPE